MICLTGLSLGTNHGCINTNLNQSVLQCNGNIPVHLQEKNLRLRHQLGMYAYRVLGFSGSTLSPFSEASYCKILLKLWDAIRRKIQANW
jgi:hypothetical protein